ncbi:RDD family protein [Kitasatospora sp. NPDC058406]|uniref:RDD family protein n=1 Tax=Kitasatospora sp. NPDC058406 TaxID=3346483 RepID=UPI003664B221
MTDRPLAGGSTETAAGPAPGYYPDPSVPGFVRYWGGTSWVPGTTRPAPAAGEVLEPPRYATRRSGAAAGVGARYMPPPTAVEPAADPVGEAAADSVSASEPVPTSEPVLMSEPVPVSPGDTGPVYLDETSGGASFTFSVPEGGPVFRTGVGSAHAAAADVAPDPIVEPAGEGMLGAVPEPRPHGAVPVAAPGSVAAVEPPDRQPAPRAPRGPMEQGAAPRWVSWGVVPGVEAPAGAAVPAPVEKPVPLRASAPAGAPVAAQVAAPTSASAEGEAVTAAASAGPEEAPLTGPTRSARPAAPVPAAPVPAAPVPAATRPPASRSAGSASAPPRSSAPRSSGTRAAGTRRRTIRPAPQPAGPGRRLAARLVDTAVLAVVATAAGIPLGTSVADHLQEKLAQARMASRLTRRQVDVWMLDGVVVGKVAVLIGILLFVGLLYEVLPTARTGQTFGKRLARIRVIDAAAAVPAAAPSAASSAARARLGLGRSLVRWLVRQVSTLLLVGLVWPLFDRPARRGWHDRAARTHVVRL